MFKEEVEKQEYKTTEGRARIKGRKTDRPTERKKKSEEK